MDSLRLLSKLITIPFAIFAWGILLILIGTAAHTICQGVKAYLACIFVFLLIPITGIYLLREGMFLINETLQELEVKNINYITDNLLINSLASLFIIGFLLYMLNVFIEMFNDFGAVSFINTVVSKVYHLYILVPITSFGIYLLVKVKKRNLSKHYIRNINLASIVLLYITAVIFWFTVFAFYLPIFSVGDCEV